jgi:DNA-binding transcriptional MerR regulator
MLIGELATRSGVTAKTLRFYEREGLVPEPDRTHGGYRDYTADIVDRVRFIKDAQASGFTLAQVAEILTIRDDGQPPCGHVADLVDQRLTEIEARLRELRAVQSELQAIAQRAETLDPTDCDGYCGLIAPTDPST